MNRDQTGARFPIAVLISGGGTTLKNLLAHITDHALPVEITLVISSAHDAKGLRYAEEAGIKTNVIRPQNHTSNEAFGDKIFQTCRDVGVQLVVMGGFLKFVPIPADFENRVINIHPGLIPAFCGKGFYGLRVHQAVLDYGAKISGCTVHFVDNQYDHGPIILQRVTNVRDDDTAKSLQQRVFTLECEAFPEAIRLIAEGRVRVEDRHVRIDAR
ncbi:MAG: phosphoribosylglycinamide formyltransferase [Pirellulaceae bacterium]|jgi:phosphoribosylglycinamide formyltransferase-1|nr:phosphoribosylglycinamide formyltransferase [Pirellulaceae bacterium]MDP6723189.1 phosphoribosylglycinamide formyltransferase [Pirellulaceae bacterium]